MDQTPWLVPASVKYLDSIIRPDWTVWEWGSGGSTVWLARRCQFVYTVEHDHGWAEAIKARMGGFGLSNFQLFEVPKGDGYYLEYADRILGHGPFDLILVDGRARPRCVVNALPRVEKVLVLDDSQRQAYQEALNTIPMPRQDFEGWENGRKVTSIWER